MKKNLVIMLGILLVLCVVFIGCSRGSGGSGSASTSAATAAATNPFLGNWTNDGNDMFRINIHDPNFTLLYGSLTANAGTYTLSGSTATWTVERQGMYGVPAETTGTATIEDGKLVGWIMDDPFTKQ
ncbi:MAG: hypothetical protein LBC80_06105 [Treponema sp.]|jgi:hypothetical protein|nr:hypothetical protein [Treponema sp.]